MIEARIVEASSTFSRDLGVKWGFSYQDNADGPNDLNQVNVGMGGSFLITPPAAGSVIGGAGLGSGITFGRVGIDSTILDLRISALESSGYGKVISTPAGFHPQRRRGDHQPGDEDSLPVLRIRRPAQNRIRRRQS